MDKNIYTQTDFMNLTNDEAADIVRILEVDLPNNTDVQSYLYNNMGIVEANEEANRIVSKKVLAGQITVKWFKFEYSDTYTKSNLIENLQKHDMGYNSNIMERVDKRDTITCSVNHGDIYTLKILINDGYVYPSIGLTTIRSEKVRSIVINIDTENCWVEMRCPEKKTRKIISILSREIRMPILNEVPILKNFCDINGFKNALVNGNYLTYKAMPIEPTELTEKDKDSIATIIKCIDEYLKDKDSDKLIQNLESMDYDTEDLSIVSILLSGLESLGMGIKRGKGNDMSNQAFYSILKDYIIENTGHISFSTNIDGPSYTMQVGLKSNNIRFNSSVNEDVIDYLREKIL